MHSTLPLLIDSDFPVIRRLRLQTVQVNLGYRCNQSCLHCHVNAGPKRKEMMDGKTVDSVVSYLQLGSVQAVDLTGGAPELNPHFRRLVSTSRSLGLRVIDRCNLTVINEPEQERLAAFLAENQVEVVASLPCYLKENVDRQRGNGVFESSIRALRILNDLGYGALGSGLLLDLVYNPQGAALPPPQALLESDYRKVLGEKYGIRFNHLLTLANMPIQRFGSTLVSRGEFGAYMALLRRSHRHENLQAVMCRTLISVDWQGYVYDCDFNQMLGIPLALDGRCRPHITDLFERDLSGNAVAVADHCYGCTAGQGSSCSGALQM
jgi:radical SAM/Cys-rich protein